MNFGQNIRRFAAASAAAVLVTGVAPAAAGAATTGGDVTDGSLDWGIKESFRGYVVSPVADGAIEVLDGASQNSDGTFHFAGGSGVVGDGTAELSFSGSVRFTGHDGALELVVSNPEVHIDGAAGSVVADVSSLSQEGELVEFPDVVLASLDVSGVSLEPDADGVVSASGIAATLSEAGAPAFGGFYEAGEALDPVSFTFSSEVGAPDDGATDEDEETGGSDADADATDDTTAATADDNTLPKTGAPWFVVAVGGLVLVAIGAGFIVTGSRRVGADQ